MIKDIQYLNAVVKQEVTAAYQRLRQAFGDTASMTETNERLLNELAVMIAEISAKANLLDQAIQRIEPNHNPTPEQAILTVNFEHNQAYILPGDLVGIENFLRIQTTTDGISYRWTGEDSVINLTLQLDRSSPLELKLHIIALIKSRFSRQMKIFVDGQRLRHRFKKDDKEFVSHCVIPTADSTGLTKLTIVLPATFTPKELGVGASTEKKGIAISKICFEQQP